jgi:hypothetical protein
MISSLQPGQQAQIAVRQYIAVTQRGTGFGASRSVPRYGILRDKTFFRDSSRGFL